MKENKELVMDKYEALAEARVPGKGKAARQIVEGSWDQEATNFVDQGRLDSMKYKLDDTLAINCAKGIVQRHPSINEQLKALKN
jgi:hypothetical protein